MLGFDGLSVSGPVNLAPNWSAESGTTDPWSTSNATLDVTDAEHHGAGSSSFLLEAESDSSCGWRTRHGSGWDRRVRT